MVHLKTGENLCCFKRDNHYKVSHFICFCAWMSFAQNQTRNQLFSHGSEEKQTRPIEDFLDGRLLRSLRCLTVKADGGWWTEFIVGAVIQSSLTCNQSHSARRC